MRNWLIAFSIISLSGLAKASSPPDLSTLLQRGLDDLYNLQLEEARANSDSLILTWPDGPQGYLLKSMVRLYGHAFAGRRDDIAAEFVALNQKAIRLSRQGDNGLTKLDRRFFEGVAYSNLALYQGMESNWYRALQYARRARRLHRDVVKTDSTYFDAYLAPGLFNYYADTLPHMLKVVSRLAGLHGEAEIGLSQITRAYAQGRLSRVEAGTFLASFQLDSGKYEAALAIYEQLAEQYPQNPYFKIHLARTLFKLERYQEMSAPLNRALRLCDGTNAHARALICYYMGRVAMIRGEFDAAGNLFRQVGQQTAGRRMIETYDGWLQGEALFRLAECAEFLGQPEAAHQHYSAAAKLDGVPNSVAEGSRNRLRHPRSDLELSVTRRCNRLAWQCTTDEIDEFSTFADSLTLSGAVAFMPLIDATLARAYSHQDNFGRAITLLERALNSGQVERFPGLAPFGRYYLGRCLLRADRPELAAVQLEAALQYQSYPEEVRLRALIERLHPL